jgi:hypothetical protein
MSTPLEFITAISLGLIAGALGQVVGQIGS